MKINLETFKDTAKLLTYGFSEGHLFTYKHSYEECLGWQKGIQNFADWLDDNGYIVVKLSNKNNILNCLYKLLCVMFRLYW